MVKVPIERIGQISYIYLGLWDSYNKDEKFFLYDFRIQNHVITCSYHYDFHTSVYIMNQETYQRFPTSYKVISGGWTGYNLAGKWVGGRWRTLKRTYGEVQFCDINNVIQQNNHNSDQTMFLIRKPMLSNRIKIQINNSKVGNITFNCNNIIFNPSNKVLLFQNETNEFVDATDVLEDGGLRLKEK